MSVECILNKNKDKLESIIRRGALEYFEFCKEENAINNIFNIELVAIIASAQKVNINEMELYFINRKKYKEHIEEKRGNVKKMIQKTFKVRDNVIKVTFEDLFEEYKKRYDVVLLAVISVFKSLDIDLKEIMSSDIFQLSSLMYLVDEIIDGNNVEFDIIEIMNNKENADKINDFCKEKESEINGK